MMRSQKDWIPFKSKFKGVAIRKGFKPALAGPRPSEEAQMVPDPTDGTGRSQVPETPIQIARRLTDWDIANSLCWAYLQDYCDDEAATVLRGCRDEDGRHGWELLEARYDSKSTSSTLMLLMALFTFAMVTGVEEHVTAWKEKIRELAQHKIELPSQLLCALYLHSLASIFEPFVTAQMMKDELDPETLYQQSIDFEKSRKLRHGEANNSEVALFTGSKEGNEDRPVCWHWEKNGRCRYGDRCKFAHPKNDNEGSRGTKRKQDERENERKELAELKKKFKKEEKANKAFMAEVKDKLSAMGATLNHEPDEPQSP